jgi:hypothetical protein
MLGGCCLAVAKCLFLVLMCRFLIKDVSNYEKKVVFSAFWVNVCVLERNETHF